MTNNYVGKNKLKVASESLEQVLLRERELKFITR